MSFIEYVLAHGNDYHFLNMWLFRYYLLTPMIYYTIYNIAMTLVLRSIRRYEDYDR
jgi:hypothetical protein